MSPSGLLIREVLERMQNGQASFTPLSQRVTASNLALKCNCRRLRNLPGPRETVTRQYAARMVRDSSERCLNRSAERGCALVRIDSVWREPAADCSPRGCRACCTKPANGALVTRLWCPVGAAERNAAPRCGFRARGAGLWCSYLGWPCTAVAAVSYHGASCASPKRLAPRIENPLLRASIWI